MKIAVALSGGVDSACSALMLKMAGHEVIALHMKLTPGHHDTWSKAKSVADFIGAPFYLVDLTEPFRGLVID